MSSKFHKSMYNNGFFKEESMSMYNNVDTQGFGLRYLFRFRLYLLVWRGNWGGFWKEKKITSGRNRCYCEGKLLWVYF